MTWEIRMELRGRTEVRYLHTLISYTIERHFNANFV